MVGVPRVEGTRRGWRGRVWLRGGGAAARATAVNGSDSRSDTPNSPKEEEKGKDGRKRGAPEGVAPI
jgi:hypothetical protein